VRRSSCRVARCRSSKFQRLSAANSHHWHHKWYPPSSSHSDKKANAAQKKLAASNAQTLRTHRYAFLAVNITFIVVRLLLRRSSSTWTLYILYLLSFATAGWLQYQLESVGTPKFDDKGGVLKTGDDLGQSGFTEYMFDVIYLTWGIQLLVAFTTTYAWWLYLLVLVSLTLLI
jgi:hypothetical protein